MYYYQYQYQRPDELYHYGVKGMRWGVRRYQNEDGSLTSAGQRHRSDREGGSYSGGSSRGSSGGSSKKSNRSKKIKRVLGLTAAAAAAAGLAYGGRKLYKNGSFTRALNRTNMAYRDAKSKYKNSKLGRKIATEKFKYQNGLSVANKVGERAALYGNKARRGVTDAAYRVGERASLYGNKAKKVASSTGLRLKNRANTAYRDARSKYKNSSLGRRIATERFKYQNGLSAANRVGERAALYGNKARRGVTDAAYRVGERAALYGHKAGSATKNARLRGSIAYNNARRKAWDTAGNIIRKRKAKKIRYTGF